MTQLQERRLNDRAEIEDRLQRLADSVSANDPDSDLGRLWADLESCLLDHFDTEAHCLFPLLARDHNAEIEALLAEHQRIRRAVADLGDVIELHALRRK